MKLKYFFFFFLFSAVVYSQEIDTTNTDEILQEAIKFYRHQDYSTSLKYTEKGLKLAPQYHDIRLFQIRNNFALGNINAVDQDLDYLIKHAPEYPNIQNLIYKRINEENKINRIKQIEKYEIVYPTDLHLKTLKASAYLENNQFELAREVAMELFEMKNLTDGDRYLLQNILKRTISDEFGLNYQILNFQGDYPRKRSWHNLSVEYQYNFKQTAVIARINHSDRSYVQGQLYEIEAYPVFNERFYGFINFGFSADEIFPDVRSNVSLFYNFAKGFEVESGLRWEKRNKNDFVSGALGLTAYVDKFYLNARSFLGPVKNEKLIQNYQFNIRYYLQNADNYLLTSIGTGISPEEQNIYSVAMDNPTLQAFFTNFGIKETFSFHHAVQLTVGLLFEEISKERRGTQFIGGINYRYRF